MLAVTVSIAQANAQAPTRDARARERQ